MKKITFVLVFIGLIYYSFTWNSIWSRNTTDSNVEETMQSSIKQQIKYSGAGVQGGNKIHNNQTGLEFPPNKELTQERLTTPPIKESEPTL